MFPGREMSGEKETIKVGMAELRVGANPDVLTCVGLGSCIGIVLYDRITKIGGLAHIMLPCRDGARDKANPAKFADSAIEVMLKKMERLGVRKRNIKARIFGGADMFPMVNSQGLLLMGERNAGAVKEELGRRKIAIVSEDIGGNAGRTITLHTKDGTVLVKTAQGKEKVY